MRFWRWQYRPAYRFKNVDEKSKTFVKCFWIVLWAYNLLLDLGNSISTLISQVVFCKDDLMKQLYLCSSKAHPQYLSSCWNRKIRLPESIEWFTEDQAFLQSLGSSPTPFTPLREQVVSLYSVFLCVPVKLTDGRRRPREGVGEDTNLTTAKKPGPLYHSILSAPSVCLRQRRLSEITVGFQYFT